MQSPGGVSCAELEVGIEERGREMQQVDNVSDAALTLDYRPRTHDMT